MNIQNFHELLLANPIAIYRNYIGDEDWFTAEIVLTVASPYQVVDGVLVHALPDQISNFNIQIELISRSQYNNRSKRIIQQLNLGTDYTQYKSIEDWSKHLLIALQDCIFYDGIHNASCFDAIEKEFMDAYHAWDKQAPMQYSSSYANHIFDNATLVHQHVVDLVKTYKD
jgi:hypothetical protein